MEEQKDYPNCIDCKHCESDLYKYPCNDCKHEEDYTKIHFEKLGE